MHQLMAIVVIVGVLFNSPAKAEYWNNIVGDGPAVSTAAEAGGEFFQSASSVFSALADLEAGDRENASESIDGAVNNIFSVIKKIDQLKENDIASRDLDLSKLDENAFTFLTSSAERDGVEIPKTYGEYFELTTRSVSRYLDTVKLFQVEPTLENYRQIRISFGEAASIGDIGSQLFSDQ